MTMKRGKRRYGLWATTFDLLADCVPILLLVALMAGGTAPFVVQFQ